MPIATKTKIGGSQPATPNPPPKTKTETKENKPGR
jgi:hypothetical protein